MRRPKTIRLALITLILGAFVFLLVTPFMVDSKPEMLTTTVDPVAGEIHSAAPLAGNFESMLEDMPFPYLQDLIMQNVANVNNAINPAVKYVHITQGLRKEQIAERFGNVLDWPPAEIEEFADTTHPDGLPNAEGYYFPGTYTVYKGENSQSASEKMFERFEAEIVERYATSTSKVIKIETALKIASLIEREAAGKHDMQLISGIIWNRIFAGMNLEIDATLQYAKGTEDNGWWPQVVPKDKYIDSPYNTYKYKGFPPTPIANPGLASVYAALNPIKTDCLFYLHDTKRRIHCAKTYEEHKKNIARYY